MKRIIIALLLVAALLLVGCAEGAGGADSGQENASESVVALSRSAGEMWLLAGGELAGVTEDGMDLEGLGDTAVSVGKLSEPSAETILALDPDKVYTASDIPGQEAVVKQLEAAGIDCEKVEVNSFDDYKRIMKEMTALTGRSDLYSKNVEDVEAGIEKILTNAVDNGKSFLVIRASATNTKVLQNDHFVAAMLTDLKMKNIADKSLLDELSVEKIAAADPDYIFIVVQGSEKKAREAFEETFVSNAVWGELKAVKNGNYHVLPKDLFQYKPNARWAEAYAELAEMIAE